MLSCVAFRESFSKQIVTNNSGQNQRPEATFDPKAHSRVVPVRGGWCLRLMKSPRSWASSSSSFPFWGSRIPSLKAVEGDFSGIQGKAEDVGDSRGNKQVQGLL